MIWDDHQNCNIGELSFRSEVKAVKLRRDRYIAIEKYCYSTKNLWYLVSLWFCRTKFTFTISVRVITFPHSCYLTFITADLKLVDHIETIVNPRGLCSLCPSPSNTVLACPGVSRGTVRIELYDARKTTLITAHEADLSQVNSVAEFHTGEL